jgi:hypothetical protein
MSGETPLGYDEQRRAIESMLESALGVAQYEYLSGPITGGPRFIRWQNSVGKVAESDDSTYQLLLQRQVIGPNIEELKGHAKAFRDSGKNIIEPGSFEAPTRLWSQQEFYRFWEAVIAEHAKGVIFLDGWHSSVGCTYEFFCAVRAGKPTFNQRVEELPPARAVELIAGAVDELTGDSARLKKHRSKLLAMKEAIAFAHSERSA